MKYLDSLNVRFKTDWLNNVSYARYYKTLGDVDGLIDAMTQHRQKTQVGGQYTSDGVTQSVRTFAASNIVPKLAGERHQIEAAATRLDEWERRLATPRIDRSDASSAALRAQIRDRIARLPEGERVARVMSAPDEQTVAAIFEAPAWLSGITDDTRKKMMEEHAQNTNAEDFAKIKDGREVLSIANAAIRIAVYEIRKNGEFRSEAAFDSWMAEASAQVEKELSNEQHNARHPFGAERDAPPPPARSAA